jgi:FkbM family methyltransferase
VLKKLSSITRPYRAIYQKIKKKLWLAHEIPFAQLHFSQFGEDLVLHSLFQGVVDGVYLDVGAFHPFLFSNTYLLHKAGWRGVNIDANPRSLSLFNSFRPNDLNIHVAIGHSAETRKFWCNGPYSSFDRRSAGSAAEEVSVQVMPLSSIVANHSDLLQKVDLLNVDCEGHDLEVLQSADCTVFRPRCIVVESAATDTGYKIEEFLAAQGYTNLLTLGLSQIFVHGG